MTIPLTGRVGRTSTCSWQLCKPDSGSHSLPRAVATVAGIRVCERHKEIVDAIREEACA